MSTYELTLLLSADSTEADSTKLLKTVTSMAGEESKILSTDFQGKKKLAFPIQKVTEAVYVFVSLSLPEAKVKDVDTKLRLSDSVIRHLLLKDNTRAARPVKKSAAKKSK